MTQAMRNAIDAGLRAFCSETGDFDMSSAMRRSAVDHIMGQPGLFPRDGTGGPMIDIVSKSLFEVSHEPEHADGWDSLPDPWKDNFRQHARAALTAMASPTQAMIRSLDDEDSDPMVARGRAYSAFVTMIQAALDEKPE